MELGISIVINLIVTVIGIVAVYAWADRKSDCKTLKTARDDYKRRWDELKLSCADVSDLLANGWQFDRERTTQMRSALSDLKEPMRYWYFQAPDESFSRRFETAVERQKALGKASRLNLPKTYVDVALEEDKTSLWMD